MVKNQQSIKLTVLPNKGAPTTISNDHMIAQIIWNLQQMLSNDSPSSVALYKG